MSANVPAAASAPAWTPPVERAVPPAAPASRRWPLRLLATAVALLLTAGLLLPSAAQHVNPAATAQAAAGSSLPLGGGRVAAAVTALVTPGGSDLASSVPPGFAEFRGYTPVPERLSDGTVRMTNPGGACSVPGGGTRFRFDAACRAHDYGYDLLRYAHATGEPLADAARKRIDGMFAQDLHAHCRATRDGLAELGCHATAEVFTLGVGVNSWRQGYGNPGDEPLPAWPLAVAVPAAAVAAPLLLRARRRRAAVQFQNYPDEMSGSAPKDGAESLWAGGHPHRTLPARHSTRRHGAAAHLGAGPHTIPHPSEEASA